MESKTHSILLSSLAENEETLSQIMPNSCSDDAFYFEATGDDPKIFPCKIDLQPVGAVVKLDITLPQEAMVQLFYQTIQTSDFFEGQSVSISHEEGRHCIEWVIDKPLNGLFRLDPGNHAGSYIIHKIEILQNYSIQSLMPTTTSREVLRFNQIRDLRLGGEGLYLKATGRDPYLLLPSITLKPEPVIIRLETTFQRDSMVQLYFQPIEKSEFTEEMSISESKPAGRHTFEWFIEQPLSGVFRLDPGNLPWEYQIHKIEALQSYNLKVIPCDQIFSNGSHLNQMEEIKTNDDGATFRASGNDPHIILPQMELLPKSVKFFLDITLPKEMLVQLYYQTINSNEFSEKCSCKSILPTGRHNVEWTIPEIVNGRFRLDPGNLPGIYRIHQIELHQ